MITSRAVWRGMFAAATVATGCSSTEECAAPDFAGTTDIADVSADTAKEAAAEVSQDMQGFVAVTRIYADEQGESHIESLQLPMGPVDFAPPAPKVNLTTPAQASAYLFLEAPKGWTSGLHPTPARQLVVVVKGELEVQTSDGDRFVGKAGDIVLAEDTAGKGHASTNVGDGPGLLAIVQLPAAPPPGQ